MNRFERCEDSADLSPFYRQLKWSKAELEKLVEAAKVDEAARRGNRDQEPSQGEEEQDSSENPTAPQLIIGSDGNDTLVGGPNNDILVAAKGHQTLTGGAGSDTFDFSKQGTNAVVTDFNVNQDKLEFDVPLLQSGQPWRISSDKGNTLIQGKDISVTLKDVAPNQLSAKDFVLPSQSALVSNNALLTQSMAAGFQNTSTASNGLADTPLTLSEKSATITSDPVLAPSSPLAHG